MSDLDIYSLIDHTELSETANEADIDEACAIATRFGCATVCVRPEWVARAAQKVLGASRSDGLSVGVTAVIDFPLGNAPTDEKVRQTVQAICDGATEIDLVMNYRAALLGDWAQVAADIAAVRDASLGVPLKVIIESAALSDHAIVRACWIAIDHAADYVKTSTGYHPAGGASAHAVALMAATIPSGMGVKASGGVRSRADLLAMVEAGATRIGTSATTTLNSDDCMVIDADAY
jgi:deoxyribose-phosphate aldolase